MKTAQPAVARYVRNEQVLWRRTCDHVVARPLGHQGDTILLSGGSAVIWQFLDGGVDIPQLMSRLGSIDNRPAVEDVRSTLTSLIDAGLVTVQGGAG